MKATIFSGSGVLLLILFITIRCDTVFAGEKTVYSWENCVRITLANNPDLLSSREGVRQKKASMGITRSTMLPQISATGSGGKNSGSTGYGSDAAEKYSYGISAKQLVFDGFKSIYDMKGAKTDIKTVMYDYSVTSGEVRLNLKNAFIQLIKAEDLLKINEEIRDRRKHVMDLVKMRYNSGTEHRGSYYSARADYLQSDAEVRSARREVGLAKKTLGYLMGLDDSPEFMIRGDMTVTGKYGNKPDFSLIAGKHPSYLGSISAVKSASLKVKSSELAFSPKLYGTASAGKSGDSPDSMSGNWALGFEITAPLFEGGNTLYQRAKAKSEYRQALFDERSVKNELMRSLEESWNSLRDSIDYVEVQKASLKAALERSKIGETQYSIGTLSFDNWTIIESNLASAKKSYLETCAAALKAEARWIQAKGGILDNEIKK